MSSVRDYEMILIFSEKDAPALEKAKADLKELISKRKVEVTKTEELGTRPLFHEKNHERRGNFNIWNIKSSSEAVKQVTADLNVNQDVLKSMIVAI